MEVGAKVYTAGGECLGDEFVDLSKLQLDSKKAILQIIYLDGMTEVLVDRIIDEHRED